MSPTLPPQLAAVLEASDRDTRESAWAAFLSAYSPVLLRVARTLGGDHDAVMNRYAFVLDELSRNDCRRLRNYVEDGRSQFTTWLVIVARRLAFDEHRRRFGRLQSDARSAEQSHRERRALVELVGDELQLSSIPTAPDDSADARLQIAELTEALREAITGLDTSDRLMLRLRFEDGLSVPQIARVMTASNPFLIYRRLDKILVQLRARLEAAGFDGPLP